MRAGLNEGSDQVAHHVVEKAVGGDTVDEEAAGDMPLRVGDGSDGGGGICGWRRQMRGFFPFVKLRVRMTNIVRSSAMYSAVGEVGVGGGEAGEVVGAEDVRGGLVEGGEIERPGTGPDGGGEGWRADVFGTGFRVQVGGVLKYGDSGLRPE